MDQARDAATDARCPKRELRGKTWWRCSQRRGHEGPCTPSDLATERAARLAAEGSAGRRGRAATALCATCGRRLVPTAGGFKHERSPAYPHKPNPRYVRPRGPALGIPKPPQAVAREGLRPGEVRVYAQSVYGGLWHRVVLGAKTQPRKVKGVEVETWTGRAACRQPVWFTNPKEETPLEGSPCANCLCAEYGLWNGTTDYRDLWTRLQDEARRRRGQTA